MTRTKTRMRPRRKSQRSKTKAPHLTKMRWLASLNRRRSEKTSLTRSSDRRSGSCGSSCSHRRRHRSSRHPHSERQSPRPWCPRWQRGHSPRPAAATQPTLRRCTKNRVEWTIPSPEQGSRRRRPRLRRRAPRGLRSRMRRRRWPINLRNRARSHRQSRRCPQRRRRRHRQVFTRARRRHPSERYPQRTTGRRLWSRKCMLWWKRCLPCNHPLRQRKRTRWL
mmetsp:Transcript_113064/g.319947  ORF Transcript_113064/g.319947 Transcript_113064/m.319947 type:complete len:222 (+) Transcript_113064:446-1111(+)